MAKPAKRIKSAAAAYVPQNRDAVITDIKRIGDLQREASRLETEMNDAIAEITEKFAARIAPIKTDIETLSKGVQGWCEANRDELTNGGKVKTANLVTGDVSWRVRPPSVSIRGMDASDGNAGASWPATLYSHEAGNQQGSDFTGTESGRRRCRNYS
ncbi:phage host-nuclease inhibitor protein Gam [Escherichia coli]|uniref:Phage host-nuclease inhibitor protein Gam n=1 Tax=Escherichia coli TaxID=562 RepID=A0A2X3JWF7_ECOLX|nr:phage host-nuclease inhibitor protein Gam [Escherichia coli]